MRCFTGRFDWDQLLRTIPDERVIEQGFHLTFAWDYGPTTGWVQGRLCHAERRLPRWSRTRLGGRSSEARNPDSEVGLNCDYDR